MKIILLSMIFFLLLVLSVHAQTDWGHCDTPYDSFECHDIHEDDCEEGLEYTRGWCPGGNNIQCCTPPKTIQGPRITHGNCYAPYGEYKCRNKDNGPCDDGMKFASGYCPGTDNIQCCVPDGTSVQEREEDDPLPEQPPTWRKTDFKVKIEGLAFCKYRVVSDGEITRDWTSISCDNEATITVGPIGDCRHNGKEICEVWKKTDLSGVVGKKDLVGKYNIDLNPPNALYKCDNPCGDFFCFNTAKEGFSCSGGTTITAGWCPGGADVKCCGPPGLLTGSRITGLKPKTCDESSLNEYHIYDSGGIVRNDRQILDILKQIKNDHGVVIIIETVSRIEGSNPEQFMLERFHQKYKLDESGIPQLNLLIVYSRLENELYAIHNDYCSISNQDIQLILQDDTVAGELENANSDEAFINLANALKDKIDSVMDGWDCENIPERRSCSEKCDSGEGCEPSECEAIGCKWYKNRCMDTDVVVYGHLTIQSRLNLIKNGNMDFIKNDPIRYGVNCAGYVTRTFEYIFGFGKRFITGAGGSAWRMPGYMEDRGATITWYDWEADEIFTDYDSLMPGDIIGFHFTESDYRPNVLHQSFGEGRKMYGHERGNTEDIDFTHAALYLGKKGDEHIITHMWHTKENPGGLRIESIEDFIRKHGNIFKIRVIMHPDQERLYRVLPNDMAKLKFKPHTIAEDDTLASITGSRGEEKEERMWITANYNHLVENTGVLHKYTGRRILVAKNTADDYDYEYAGVEDHESELIQAIARTIREKNPEHIDDGEEFEWARAIVRNLPYKTGDYAALTMTVIRQESGFRENPISFDNWNLKSELAQRFGWLVGKEYSATSGCMQTRTCKARKIARKEGRDPDDVMYDIVKLDGCLFYGIRQLQGIIEANTLSSPGEPPAITLEDLLFIGAEVKSGVWSSRNAALQSQINDILNINLALDGDFLSYNMDFECTVKPDVTNTEQAVRDLSRVYGLGWANEQIRSDLLLEKSKEFENTRVYREIRRLWKEHANIPYSSLSEITANVDQRKIVGSNSLEITTGTQFSSTRDYGNCINPYQHHFCQDVTDGCDNGNFVPFYCPTQPENIKCCVDSSSIRDDNRNPIAVISMENLIEIEPFQDVRLEATLINSDGLCDSGERIYWYLFGSVPPTIIEETGKGTSFTHLINSGPYLNRQLYQVYFYCAEGIEPTYKMIPIIIRPDVEKDKTVLWVNQYAHAFRDTFSGFCSGLSTSSDQSVGASCSIP
ncbi:DUF1615 family protein [Candidatus Aenigmatarchaeota archaeon]